MEGEFWMMACPSRNWERWGVFKKVVKRRFLWRLESGRKKAWGSLDETQSIL